MTGPKEASGLIERLDAHRFVRFCLVGLTNTAISYLAFALVFRFTKEVAAGAAIAQIVSYAAGILWSYVWNSRLTFSSSLSASGFWRFGVIQILLLAFSAAMMGLLVDTLHLPATLSWLGVMAVVTIANFLALRRFVYDRD